jgi:alkanesulfonate monooxygenase SsuD/methylene tetrahydromethanopterin reductase-like flavin-dependent oxidoreductase (luciferase family)
VTAPAGAVRQGLDRWRRGRLVGTVEQAAEQLQIWQALGVSTVILNLGPVPFSVASDDGLDVAMDACSLAGCRTSERRS